MTQPEPAACGVCGSPSGDGGHLCRLHTTTLADTLTTVRDLTADLEVTLTRQDRIALERTGGRSSTTPLPWNDNASQRAHELNACLNAWALDTARIREDLERDPLAAHHHSDTPAVAEWLRRNLPTLRRHPEAGTAHTQITDAIRDARRAIDRPQSFIPLGPCGNTEGVDEPCPAIVYGHPESLHATCRACAARHSIATRLEWMLELLRVQLVTLPEAVGICELAGKRTSEDKLRLMATRGRFLSAGIRGDKPTYRMADVFQALDDRYKHRKPRAA